MADISTDNPNVWFELGFAIASQKDVVLVCSDQRQSKFPFDVQHRSIIRYSTESSRDFKALEEKITERVKAIIRKEDRLSSMAPVSPIANIEGLAQHEIVALVTIAENIDHPEDNVSTYVVRNDMEKAGFTRVATTLGLATLIKKGLVQSAHLDDERGEPYSGYSLTPKGLHWLMDNQDRLTLMVSPQETKTNDDPRDDIPF